jgi:endonuclease III
VGTSRRRNVRTALAALRRRYGPLRTVPGVSDKLRQLLFLQLQDGMTADHAASGGGAVTAKRALQALEAVERATVDWNEARVLPLPDLMELLRSTGKDGLEGRAERMKVLLMRLFQDHHDVSVEPLLRLDFEKRRKYLASLDALRPEVTQAFLVYALGEGEEYRPTGDLLRVLHRLGFVSGTSVKAGIRFLKDHAAQRQDAADLVGQFERLARLLCVPRNPLCPECPLAEDCPFGGKTVARKRKEPDAAGEKTRAA